MARAALRMTAKALADASGVSLATIQRMETVDGEPPSTRANLAAIERALIAAGVQFIERNGGGYGVRLRDPGE